MTSPDWYRPPTADGAATSLDAWQPQSEDTVGFWMRAQARILDALAGGVVAAAAGFLGALIRGVGVPVPALSMTFGQSMLVSIGLALVTDTLALSIGGTTPGKYLLGLRVRMMDGAMCTFGAAFKRELLYFWDALFFAIIAYSTIKSSPWQQRTGDRWARTLVVRNGAMPAGARGGQRAILGALAFVAVYFAYNLVVIT